VARGRVEMINPWNGLDVARARDERHAPELRAVFSRPQHVGSERDQCGTTGLVALNPREAR